MKQSLGIKPYTFPMPVLMIATYNEDDSVNVMNMAWGGICGSDMVALNISEGHKTHKNLRERKAFTLSVANAATAKESDYFGIATGNKTPDKFDKTELTASKSDKVDAPIVDQYPLTLVCEVAEFQDQPYGLRVLGRILDVVADDSILDEDGKVVPEKMNAILFDTFTRGYYAIGERVGTAWDMGRVFMEDND